IEQYGNNFQLSCETLVTTAVAECLEVTKSSLAVLTQNLKLVGACRAVAALEDSEMECPANCDSSSDCLAKLIDSVVGGGETACLAVVPDVFDALCEPGVASTIGECAPGGASACGGPNPDPVCCVLSAAANMCFAAESECSEYCGFGTGTTSQCPPGEECFSGLCAPAAACVTSSDCEEGFVCAEVEKFES